MIDKILNSLEAEIDSKDVQYFLFGKPYALGNDHLNRGVIMVKPSNTAVQSVTTGINDEYTLAIEIILAFNVKRDFNRNDQKEQGDLFAIMTMEGRDEHGFLLPKTIAYIVRKNLRQWGLLQPNITVDYDTGEVEQEGSYTAKMTITGIEHISQQII